MENLGVRARETTRLRGSRCVSFPSPCSRTPLTLLPFFPFRCDGTKNAPVVKSLLCEPTSPAFPPHIAARLAVHNRPSSASAALSLLKHGGQLRESRRPTLARSAAAVVAEQQFFPSSRFPLVRRRSSSTLCSSLFLPFRVRQESPRCLRKQNERSVNLPPLHLLSRPPPLLPLHQRTFSIPSSHADAQADQGRPTTSDGRLAGHKRNGGELARGVRVQF